MTPSCDCDRDPLVAFAHYDICTRVMHGGNHARDATMKFVGKCITWASCDRNLAWLEGTLGVMNYGI